MGTSVNFYQELDYLLFILRMLVFIFLTNKSKFLKQFYNMCLWKLLRQHAVVSVMQYNGYLRKASYSRYLYEYDYINYISMKSNNLKLNLKILLTQ